MSELLKTTSRRSFLKSAAGAVAIGFPTIVPSSVLGKGKRPAPGSRVTVAIIGTGNQGTNDLKQFLKDERVQVVAVCDVNRESEGYWSGGVAGREPARRMVEQHYGATMPSGTYRGCSAVEDFRDVLARGDIDAVEVATPDHWHAIPVIAAARARKDIYCQKPLALTIAEGRAMSDAVKRYGCVFQTGSQQRSDKIFRHGCELVRNGRIGKLHTVKCGLPSGSPDLGKTGHRKAPEPVPEGFNYEFWLGPGPQAPYSPARCHVNFRWNLDYSGGQVTDWGGHHPDIAQWGMDTERTGPVLIQNAKGEFPPRSELWNTANHYYFECLYQNGVKLIVSDQFPMGVRFEGSEGWIHLDRGKYQANPASLWHSVIGPKETRLYESANHFRNFIDCIYSRREPIAPCEVAHRSITIAHLGNIAMQLGRDLKWNPRQEKFVNDPEGNKLLSRSYRGPWKMG